MLVELASVMRQPQGPGPAHEQLQPYIFFQPGDRAADCRFWLAKPSGRGRDAANLGHGDEGR
jgi:hypothetical protein